MEASAEAKGLTEQADQWVSQYRQCIEAVFLDYLRSGVWPNVEEFQQRLVVAGSDIALWPFADALRYNRRWLGWVDPPGERIELRLRAWHGLGGAARDYAAFVVLAVRTAAGLYRANKSVLTESDLRPQLSGPWVTNEFTWRLLMGLVEQESFYFLQPGPLMTSPDWGRPIDKRRIGRFLKVRTVDDYLLATAQLHVDSQPSSWQARASGIPLSHRLEVPNVTNIYNINTAGMVNVNPETVNVIQSQIQAIASQEPELAQRLARLTEALEAPEFSGAQRKQLEENIQDLAAEVKQPQDQRRRSRIKAYAGAIAELAPLAPKFLEAWNQVWPLIEKLKGH